MQIAVALMIVLPTVYLGLGYVIASQAIAAKPGCYVWEDNHPDSWTSFDDWESFGTGEVAEERVAIRQNFDATPYQMESYENASFPPEETTSRLPSGMVCRSRSRSTSGYPNSWNALEWELQTRTTDASIPC